MFCKDMFFILNEQRKSMNIFSCHIGKNYQGAVLGFALLGSVVVLSLLWHCGCCFFICSIKRQSGIRA
jgi:hypothetical protein